MTGTGKVAHAADGRKHPYPAIWRAVKRIPRGRVSTYGTIAALAGLPGHARLVGYALHRLPEGTEVPWQRVVDARGRISLPSAVAARAQATLLEREGVRFRSGRIPLAEFGWPGGSFR